MKEKSESKSEIQWKPAERWGFYEVSKDGVLTGYRFGDPFKFVETFLTHFNVKYVNGVFYQYNPTTGIYEKDVEELKIRPFIYRALEAYKLESISLKPKVDQLIDIIKSKTIVREEDFKSPYSMINLKNGVLDLDTKSLSPHDPKYNFIGSYTKAMFNPSVGIDVAKNFVTRCVGEDNEPTIGETWGYIFIPGYPIKQFIRYHGASDSGKSTLLMILEFLAGSESIGSTSLRTLCDPKKSFAMCDLYGKKANISPEENNLSFDDSSIIKSLLGSDSITADRKNREPIKFKNQAKLFITENKGIHTKEVSEDFWKKSFVIPFDGVERPFNTELHGKNVLPHYSSILSDETLLSQFLNYLVIGYDRIKTRIKNGEGFTTTSSMDIAMFSDQKRANKIGGWICDNVDGPIQDCDKRVFISEIYRRMLDETGKSITLSDFCECIHDKFPFIERKQTRLKDGDPGYIKKGDNEKRAYAYFGIYWKESSQREADRKEKIMEDIKKAEAEIVVEKLQEKEKLEQQRKIDAEKINEIKKIQEEDEEHNKAWSEFNAKYESPIPLRAITNPIIIVPNGK